MRLRPRPGCRQSARRSKEDSCRGARGRVPRSRSSCGHDRARALPFRWMDTGPEDGGRVRSSSLLLVEIRNRHACYIPSERRFLRFAMRRLGHLFPYLPKQPGYNKRMRALAPQIVLLFTRSRTSRRRGATGSACWTPRQCRAAPRGRQSSARTSPATPPTGIAPATAGYFWGFRLYLLCATDGMPIAFEAAPANASEREVAAEMLARA